MFQRLCPLYILCVCFQVCFGAALYADEIPPSPAGGGWLELTRPGGYVTVADHPDFDANLTSEFTVQMWIYLKSYPKFGEAWPLIHKPGSYSLTFWGHSLKLDGTINKLPKPNVVSIYYDFSGSATGKSVTSEWVPLNTWIHLICVKKETLSLYLNGRRLFHKAPLHNELNDSGRPLYFAGSPVLITRFEAFPWEPFTGGLIDEIAVAKMAQHSPQRLGIPIPAGRLGATRDRVALWHFDGLQKSAFADSSQFRTHNLVPVHVKTGPYAVEAVGKLAVSWGHIKVR